MRIRAKAFTIQAEMSDQAGAEDSDTGIRRMKFLPRRFTRSRGLRSELRPSRAGPGMRFGLGEREHEGRTVRGVSEEMGLPLRSVQHLLWTALSKMRKPHVAAALREYASDEFDV